MTADGWVLGLAFALCGAGALVAYAVPPRRNPVLLAWVGALAGATLLWVSASVLATGQAWRVELWAVPQLGTLAVALDPLSALFLLLTGIVVLASSIFSAGYLQRYLEHYSLRAFTAWYLLLVAAVVLTLIAADALLFLLAWEAMSILSYLLVNFEHRRPDTSRAAYAMLAMGEVGFVAVAIVLLVLAVQVGSLQFDALRHASATLGPLARWLVFLLTFFGFGVKAGLVPLNTWLPRAHPAAPANVSAILSGVILNLGLYGILRIDLDLVPVSSVLAGAIVLVVGTASALVGILYATVSNDLKAMLAHSSIENIGIVTAGLGAGFIFAVYDRQGLASIAFLTALYHMCNHTVYKALLFLGAGAIDASAGTRDLNRLGGLIRGMPATAAVFLVGSLSIAGLPPFNGFVSEWLTLQTLLRSSELPTTVVKVVFAVCGAGLALTAALAVTCFVKAYAMGFLGMSRSDQAMRAREVRPSSVAAMALLAVLCLMLGVLPTYVIPLLDPVVAAHTGASAADALVPPFFAAAPGHAALPAPFMAEFHDLGAQVGDAFAPGRGLVVLHRGGEANPVVFAMSTTYMLIALLGLLLLVWLVVRLWLTRSRRLARRERWDGGVRRLLPEMTYTATGFSNPVRVIFDAIFRPTTVEDTSETVAAHFRMAIRREQATVHIVDRMINRPAMDAMLSLARALATLHHGRINAYAAYVLLSLAGVLVIAFSL